MINETITNTGVSILDVLQEFYEKNIQDRNLIDKLIEVFKLESGPQSAFLADNAKLINSLIGARQKTTNDLLSMLTIVQKLQSNQLSSGEDGLSEIKEMMKQRDNLSDDEEVENLIEKIKLENEMSTEANTAIKTQRKKIA